MVLIQLGRAGDIINVLPLAFSLSRKLGRINWVVSMEHAGILDGVSYVNPLLWNGNQDTLPAAVRFYGNAQPLVTQAFLNPDSRRLTSSFALEQWRYAGALGERDKWPLLFDQRDTARERTIVTSERARRNPDRPLVLVATTSISTPYRHANKLLATIRGLDADVIDLSDVRAYRIYDLIALYDIADCLVTVDTAHLHLARASQCPVVALLNDGWRGAVPTPQTVAHWRYAELGDDLSPVVQAVEQQLSRKVSSLATVIHTWPQGHIDRHFKAMATHPADTIRAVFNHRPKVKEMLALGLKTGKDAVCFTNDDTGFLPDTEARIMAHAQKWDFGCSRRPRVPTHVGREIFWFKSDWLKAHWDELPECYWTVHCPDLIFTRFLRRLRGIETTMANLEYDFAPVEVPAGIISHEDHPSHWNTEEVLNSKEAIENARMWREG